MNRYCLILYLNIHTEQNKSNPLKAYILSSAQLMYMYITTADILIQLFLYLQRVWRNAAVQYRSAFLSSVNTL